MDLELNINLNYKDGNLTVSYGDGSNNESYDIANIDQLPEKARQLVQDEVNEHKRFLSTLRTMDVAGFSCAECGTEIKPGDTYTVCGECGAVFCLQCAKDGALDNHACDDIGDGPDNDEN